MLSGDEVRDLIAESGAQIAATLRAHPKAGQKFADAKASTQEAWIAWTWLHRRLVHQGLSVAEALEIREDAMTRQHDVGTYEAIADSLG